MEYLENIMRNFTRLEEFVIKGTILISAVLFCLRYIWNHIKNFEDKK